MEKLNKKAYYHLPGLFEFYELYRVFLPVFREHIENIFMNGVKSALSMDLRRIVSGEEVVLALVRIIQKKL